jgi:PhoD-like phosphatase
VIWVETDAPCDVEVHGSRERTFHVEGHHYGLVRVEGLEPGEWIEYDVALDGERAWPPPDSRFPPSVIRTYPRDEPVTIAFGSCRVTAPHEPPYSLRKDEDERGRETDALRAMALRMLHHPREEWPHVVLMLGDQVYADEVSPETREFIQARRDTSKPPGERIANFEEYTRLYREAWTEPVMRWLLSTVSSAMIFDDHDVHDDWNISEAWVEEMRSRDWWDEHMAGGLMSYWLYQHIGNLAPGQHDHNELLHRVQAAGDAGPLLRDFARKADRENEGTRWSYCRDIGGTRLVVVDSRAGRVLRGGTRKMVDEHEWKWIVDHATGGFDHLLIATSVPFLLNPGMHYFEAWSEAVCAGAWGGLASRLGEKVRQTADLEHWAAFGDSFERVADLVRSVGAGERGEPPATIVALSGDVHHAYLHEVAFPRRAGVQSGVFQAVCSPFRNPLDSHEKRFIAFGGTRAAHAIGRLLARGAGVPDPPIRWRPAGCGPWFNNQFSTLEIDGRDMHLRIEKALPAEHGEERIDCVFERPLTAAADGANVASQWTTRSRPSARKSARPSRLTSPTSTVPSSR